MFGHLPGLGPTKRKSGKLFLLEIRIGSLPKQEFLTLTGVGSEVHLGFFPHRRHFFFMCSERLYLGKSTTLTPLKMS